GLTYAINVELPSRRGKGEHLSRLETRIEQEKNEIKQSKEKLSKLKEKYQGAGLFEFNRELQIIKKIEEESEKEEKDLKESEKPNNYLISLVRRGAVKAVKTSLGLFNKKWGENPLELVHAMDPITEVIVRVSQHPFKTHDNQFPHFRRLSMMTKGTRVLSSSVGLAAAGGTGGVSLFVAGGVNLATSTLNLISTNTQQSNYQELINLALGDYPIDDELSHGILNNLNLFGLSGAARYANNGSSIARALASTPKFITPLQSITSIAPEALIAWALIDSLVYIGHQGLRSHAQRKMHFLDSDNDLGKEVQEKVEKLHSNISLLEEAIKKNLKIKDFFGEPAAINGDENKDYIQWIKSFMEDTNKPFVLKVFVMQSLSAINRMKENQTDGNTIEMDNKIIGTISTMSEEFGVLGAFYRITKPNKYLYHHASETEPESSKEKLFFQKKTITLTSAAFNAHCKMVESICKDNKSKVEDETKEIVNEVEDIVLLAVRQVHNSTFPKNCISISTIDLEDLEPKQKLLLNEMMNFIMHNKLLKEVKDGKDLGIISYLLEKGNLNSSNLRKVIEEFGGNFQFHPHKENAHGVLGIKAELPASAINQALSIIFDKKNRNYIEPKSVIFDQTDTENEIKILWINKKAKDCGIEIGQTIKLELDDKDLKIGRTKIILKNYEQQGLIDIFNNINQIPIDLNAITEIEFINSKATNKLTPSELDGKVIIYKSDIQEEYLLYKKGDKIFAKHGDEQIEKTPEDDIINFMKSIEIKSIEIPNERSCDIEISKSKNMSPSGKSESPNATIKIDGPKSAQQTVCCDLFRIC
ncbi:MAG: hypothetical protein ACI9IL_000079, partial [Rickettsiales bacterium]